MCPQNALRVAPWPMTQGLAGAHPYKVISWRGGGGLWLLTVRVSSTDSALFTHHITAQVYHLNKGEGLSTASNTVRHCACVSRKISISVLPKVWHLMKNLGHSWSLKGVKVKDSIGKVEDPTYSPAWCRSTGLITSRASLTLSAVPRSVCISVLPTLGKCGFTTH